MVNGETAGLLGRKRREERKSNRARNISPETLNEQGLVN